MKKQVSFTGADEEQEFLALISQIQHDRGFDCAQYKPAFLKRRLAVRLRARKVSSYREYMRLLDDAEYIGLFQALTVNLSHFFRDETVFQALKEQVLKPMIRTKGEQNRCSLRIWSAGCATGEEPYSVAIMLHELLGNRLQDWTVRVYATDLDPEALEHARRGVYTDFSFRGADQVRLARYFEPVGGRQFALKPEIGAMVQFRQQNLMADAPPQRLDLILCRNVLIYFARPQQDRLFVVFHRALVRGGYLVIGKTEILSPIGASLFEPLDRWQRIYVKLEARDREPNGGLGLPTMASARGVTNHSNNEELP